MCEFSYVSLAFRLARKTSGKVTAIYLGIGLNLCLPVAFGTRLLVCWVLALCYAQVGVPGSGAGRVQQSCCGGVLGLNLGYSYLYLSGLLASLERLPLRQ